MKIFLHGFYIILAAHFTRNLARGVADVKIFLQGFYIILAAGMRTLDLATSHAMCGFMSRFLLT